jgi:hypothetical protein
LSAKAAGELFKMELALILVMPLASTFVYNGKHVFFHPIFSANRMVSANP